MSVTIDDVKKVSHLARIKVGDSKVNEIKNSLNQILRFIEQLDSVDCSNVEGDVQYETALHERSDVVVPCCSSEIINLAPKSECGMFVVPKVV